MYQVEKWHKEKEDGHIQYIIPYNLYALSDVSIQFKHHYALKRKKHFIQLFLFQLTYYWVLLCSTNGYEKCTKKSCFY